MVLRAGDAACVMGPAFFATSWRELIELGARHPGSPALVDPGFRDREQPLSEAWTRTIPHELPGTPLIRYARAGSGEPEEEDAGLFFLARLQAGRDDELGSIDTAILRCADMQCTSGLLARLQRSCPPVAGELFRRLLHLSVRAPSVPAVAASFGLHERTLQRRCVALGIPKPNALISMARIFTVERLAAWSRQVPAVVAVALGFSHRSNYGRTVRQTFGVTPSVLRDRGGTDFIAQTIVSALTSRLSQHPP